MNDKDIINFKQISLNIDDGYYIVKVIKTEDGKVIQEMKYDISVLQDKLNDLTNDVNNVKSDLSLVSDKVNNKVEVNIIPDLEDESNVTLKIFK